jgi:hypothetical protein
MTQGGFAGQAGTNTALIEACLANVRIGARLDDPSVLPSFDAILRTRGVDGRIDVHRPTPHVPSAGAIEKSIWAVRQASPSLDLLPMRSERVSPKAHPKKTLANRLRWPVLLCGFLAGIFGGVSLMKSPVGRTRPVQKSVIFTKRQVASLVVAGRIVRAELTTNR